MSYFNEILQSFEKLNKRKLSIFEEKKKDKKETIEKKPPEEELPPQPQEDPELEKVQAQEPPPEVPQQPQVPEDESEEYFGHQVKDPTVEDLYGSPEEEDTTQEDFYGFVAAKESGFDSIKGREQEVFGPEPVSQVFNVPDMAQQVAANSPAIPELLLNHLNTIFPSTAIPSPENPTAIPPNQEASQEIFENIKKTQDLIDNFKKYNENIESRLQPSFYDLVHCILNATTDNKNFLQLATLKGSKQKVISSGMIHRGTFIDADAINGAIRSLTSAFSKIVKNSKPNSRLSETEKSDIAEEMRIVAPSKSVDDPFKTSIYLSIDGSREALLISNPNAYEMYKDVFKISKFDPEDEKAKTYYHFFAPSQNSMFGQHLEYFTCLYHMLLTSKNTDPVLSKLASESIAKKYKHQSSTVMRIIYGYFNGKMPITQDMADYLSDVSKAVGGNQDLATELLGLVKRMTVGSIPYLENSKSDLVLPVGKNVGGGIRDDYHYLYDSTNPNSVNNLINYCKNILLSPEEKKIFTLNNPEEILAELQRRGIIESINLDAAYTNGLKTEDVKDPVNNILDHLGSNSIYANKPYFVLGEGIKVSEHRGVPSVHLGGLSMNQAKSIFEAYISGRSLTPEESKNEQLMRATFRNFGHELFTPAGLNTPDSLENTLLGLFKFKTRIDKEAKQEEFVAKSPRDSILENHDRLMRSTELAKDIKKIKQSRTALDKLKKMLQKTEDPDKISKIILKYQAESKYLSNCLSFAKMKAYLTDPRLTTAKDRKDRARNLTMLLSSAGYNSKNSKIRILKHTKFSVRKHIVMDHNEIFRFLHKHLGKGFVTLQTGRTQDKGRILLVPGSQLDFNVVFKSLDKNKKPKSLVTYSMTENNIYCKLNLTHARKLFKDLMYEYEVPEERIVENKKLVNDLTKQIIREIKDPELTNILLNLID